MNNLSLVDRVNICSHSVPALNESILVSSGYLVCPLLNIYQQDICPYLSKASQVFLVQGERGREYPICRMARQKPDGTWILGKQEV